jgi:sensor histidine kinase YesM
MTDFNNKYVIIGVVALVLVIVGVMFYVKSCVKTEINDIRAINKKKRLILLKKQEIAQEEMRRQEQIRYQKLQELKAMQMQMKQQEQEAQEAQEAQETHTNNMQGEPDKELDLESYMDPVNNEIGAYNS